MEMKLEIIVGTLLNDLYLAKQIFEFSFAMVDCNIIQLLIVFHLKRHNLFSTIRSLISFLKIPTLRMIKRHQLPPPRINISRHLTLFIS